jgi:hypothetical protein
MLFRDGVMACGQVGVMLLVASNAFAQEWSVEAQAGKYRSTLAAAATQNVVLGLRYEDDVTGFRISGGVPTQSTEPYWGAIAGSRRLQLQKNIFLAGIDVAANGFVLHDRVQRTQTIPGSNGGLFGGGKAPQTVAAPSFSGTAFAAQALPFIGIEFTSIQATLRGGVSTYSSDFADTKASRQVSLADAQLTFTPSPTFAIVPAARFYHADEADYKFAGVSAIRVSGPISVWGSVGSWLNAADSNSMTWGAGATLKLHRNASINFSARHDGLDPLYLSPSQTSWSVGVALHIGGAKVTAPIPAKYEAGRATIKLSAKNTAAPRVAGDFNGWKPQPMQRINGEWTFSAPLKPGVYNFAFVDDNGNWFVPEKYPGRKPDGMGGYVAVLIVQ